jgi:hypothetical protein
MNNLFPIVRRKRRPLFVEDAPPVMVGNVEPVNADAKSESEDGGLKMEDGNARGDSPYSNIAIVEF